MLCSSIKSKIKINELVNNTIFFAPGENRQFVEIDILNDQEIEETESFNLKIVDPGFGSPQNYVVGEQNTTTVEIIDSSPTVEFGEQFYTVNEDDGLTMVVEVFRSRRGQVSAMS